MTFLGQYTFLSGSQQRLLVDSAQKFIEFDKQHQ